MKFLALKSPNAFGIVHDPWFDILFRMNLSKMACNLVKSYIYGFEASLIHKSFEKKLISDLENICVGRKFHHPINLLSQSIGQQIM